MLCASCGSENLGKFTAEMAVHFNGEDEPPAFVFPKIAVCLTCGVAQFALAEAELRLLAAKTDAPR